MAKDLAELRQEIDTIDNKLAALFKERMDVAHRVAQFKAQNRVGILHRDRERNILHRVTDISGKDLELYTRILYSTIFDLSRAYQNAKIKHTGVLRKKIEEAIENTPDKFPHKAFVACQGTEGAYSQIACDQMFPLANALFFKSFEDVFEAVDKGMCRYGILPVENSIHGSVNAVYDLMQKHNFYISRSLKLRIEHNLLSAKGAKIEDIKEIYSHEQAVGQCSRFLQNHPDININIVANTAIAARMVAESGRSDVAAISSSACASIYNLDVLDTTIQNSANNYTRFICITKDMEIYQSANKISLVLSLSHEPGALNKLLSRFAALGINVAKLESRPIPGKDFEFLFYVDLNASVLDPVVLNLITGLSEELSSLTFLGCYTEI